MNRSGEQSTAWPVAPTGEDAETRIRSEDNIDDVKSLIAEAEDLVRDKEREAGDARHEVFRLRVRLLELTGR